MNKLIAVILLFSSCEKLFGQKLALPKNPYVLVIGKYRLESKTIVEQDPSYYGGLMTSSVLPGTELQLKLGDSSMGHCANCDSLRLWTYLFRDERFRINFPATIDTVNVINLISEKESIHIDTIDHIDINKVIDTISLEELKKFVSSEVQVYNGSKKLKVQRISVYLIWPNGEKHGTNYEKLTIDGNNYIRALCKKLIPGSYIIIDEIWYYNLKGEQDAMTGDVGWMIK